MDDCNEFKYDYDDFMKEEKLCVECNKKYKNKHNVNMCRGCFRKYLITKTNAKRVYKLTDKNLKNLHEFSCPAQSGGIGTMYLLREVRIKTLEKNFNLYEPMDIEEYKKYLDKFFTKMKNKENKKEEEKDLRIKMRKIKLKKALEERGLELRNDSYYCDQYIYHNKFSLKKVCDMMQVMNFLFKKTKYTSILDDIREDILDDYRCKFESPDLDMQIPLNEKYREMAKEMAIKRYIKKHGKKDVPKSVLDYVEAS